MFSTSVNLGGLVRKIPWRLSSTRKFRVRERLRDVDENIQAIKDSGVQFRQLDVASGLPSESSMPPRDKYFTFNKNSPTYRKGVHKVPKWTRLTQRTNPTARM
ncbi:hypothetical protein J056_003892 [Wallemia ichthyophaga EXF-994]|uniref:54S ribosomal protein L31, mitochondrial n=1 Tax=Wallemia ichthyophaga (strain EXF-994 / CBS 113033) TaxID=1299270 RepID=R9ANG1_WALI9|nr:uncharacterized protein J056_003892 [Wallemia ichthyophaga EXF-994]EOR01656.1 hypothetical protein J056_003892 [Wallemia ichthyophaga EXF-994]